jgi:hypothetical protein
MSMSKERFAAILAAYGADPRRWPSEERAPAAAFARSADMRAELAGARAVDALLALDAAAPTAEAKLVARILAAAPRALARFDWRAPAMALAACAVAGVLIGYGAGAMAPPTGVIDAMLSDAFASPQANALDPGDAG